MTRRTVTRPEVRVGGFWLSSIVPQGWGGLGHGTRLNGGWQASWTIPPSPLTRQWRHPALVYGALVEIYLGPACIWSGTLDEPNWDTGTFLALGSCRDAETAQAIDADGNASRVPNTVIDAAIARGVLSWTRAGDFGDTPVGDDDASGLTTVQALLDAWAEANGAQWKVDARRRLVIAPSITAAEADPIWYIAPGADVLGSSAVDRVDAVFVRYIDSTSGLRQTVRYPATTPTGGIEKGYPIIDRGAMPAAEAVAVAQAIWGKLAGRSGWTNGATLSRGMVTTRGGITPDLALIEAGQGIRLLGQHDPRGIALNLDVVIGETDYDWTDDECQANPVGMAATDENALLEDALDTAHAAMARANTAMTVA